MARLRLKSGDASSYLPCAVEEFCEFHCTLASSTARTNRQQLTIFFKSRAWWWRLNSTLNSTHNNPPSRAAARPCCSMRSPFSSTRVQTASPPAPQRDRTAYRPSPAFPAHNTGPTHSGIYQAEFTPRHQCETKADNTPAVRTAGQGRCTNSTRLCLPHPPHPSRPAPPPR